jgi:hypothetical protein
MDVEEYLIIKLRVNRGEVHVASLNQMKELLALIDDTRHFLRKIRGQPLSNFNDPRKQTLYYWQKEAGELLRRLE